ncbi:MAG: hypothetical protein NPIRA04_08040 [Nitrospirales bacterium]|nr:MAG: hypothetical protein NPIRA04_08040 [Nitrospirales bacterium]
MTLPFIRGIVLAICIVLLSGCSGYDRILFATKTNVGLDIDTEPPTAELTIARRELAIQPNFSNVDKEGGLSLLAAFGLTGNFFNPSITAHFAGGDAAAYLPPGNNAEPVNSGLCLSQKPQDPRGLLLRFWHSITGQDYEDVKDEPRPFYFAADTSYGLKVAWSGTAGPYPDSLKLGYNRKEFASPPIFVDREKSCVITEEGPLKGNPGYEVKIPSFYAALDNAGGFTTLTESGVKHVQFFATGEAATRFARDPYVKKIAFSQMAPAAATLKANELGLNEALIQEIEEAFQKANAEKKTEIMSAAKTLKLVKDETTSNSFVEEIKKHSDTPDPKISTNLIIVRRVAVAPPDEPADPAEPLTPEDPSAPTD